MPQGCAVSVLLVMAARLLTDWMISTYASTIHPVIREPTNVKLEGDTGGCDGEFTSSFS